MHPLVIGRDLGAIICRIPLNFPHQTRRHCLGMLTITHRSSTPQFQEYDASHESLNLDVLHLTRQNLLYISLQLHDLTS